MVSALDSESGGSHSLAGWIIVLCSWAKQYTFALPLSPQEYEHRCSCTLPPQGETEAFHLGEKGMATGRLQEYKCVQVNCQGSLSGGNLVMDWYPIKGGGGEGEQL